MPVDHHRSLVWFIVRDLFVHIEQVTVFLLNDLFTQAIDRVGEIQEYGQAVLFTPKPASQRSLAAREATSRGTKFPNAG